MAPTKLKFAGNVEELKMGKAGRQGKRQLWKLTAALIIVFGVFSAGVFVTANMVVEPNLESVSRMRAEAMISRTVNKALAAQFNDKKYAGEAGDLFTIKKDDQGTVEMVQANSIEINILMSELSVKVQDSFQQMDKERFDVPVGTLLGNKFISQIGPSVEVEVFPIGVSSTDFRTEFEAKGINQTKYKIYIEMDCRVKVLAPFSSKVFNTSSTILVAEAVILGDVPNSYVQVPKDDILDVTDE